MILVGKGEPPVHLLTRYGNRHGLVAGATGPGKTVRESADEMLDPRRR
jgi:hypothetical protein